MNVEASPGHHFPRVTLLIGKDALRFLLIHNNRIGAVGIREGDGHISCRPLVAEFVVSQEERQQRPTAPAQDAGALGRILVSRIRQEVGKDGGGEYNVDLARTLSQRLAHNRSRRLGKRTG